MGIWRATEFIIWDGPMYRTADPQIAHTLSRAGL